MFITEISKKLKITARAIRHYEEIGIIKSKRLENNYRYFDEPNVDKLKCINIYLALLFISFIFLF